MDDCYYIPNEVYHAMRCRNSDELCTFFKSRSYIKLALRVIEDRPEGKVSILMLAAIYNLEDVAKLLLSWDSSSEHIDLRGTVQSVDGDQVSNVTALWCAVDRGHDKLASMLIRAGVTDLRDESPLTYFIQRGRLDRIQYLLDNNDRLSIIVDHSTLFMYFHLAVSEGHGNIVLYFLAYGVIKAVRMGLYRGEALEKAIINGHDNCVEILCGTAFSAAFHYRNKEKYLELAIKHNRLRILDFLLDFFKDESSIDAVEILASASLIPLSDQIVSQESRQIIDVLKCAVMKRASLRIPKKTRPLLAAYGFRQECQSVEELELISDNLELTIQALLIRERLILPMKDRKILFGLNILAIHLTRRHEFDQSFLLWIHHFKLCEEMEIDIDLQDFVWLFCQMLVSRVTIRTESILEICQLVFHPTQSTWTTRRLAVAVCLVAIIGKILEQGDRDLKERRALLQWIESLCQRQPISEDDDRTMLHLSVSKKIYRLIDFRPMEIESILLFPSKQTTWLLINCGRRWIDIDAKDRILGDTPLHVIARSASGINAIEIIKLLLNAQAHIDCVNEAEETPAEVAFRPDIVSLLKSEQNPPRLKCLCARLIMDDQFDCTTILHSSRTDLYRFVLSHGKRSETDSMVDDLASTYGDVDLGFDLFE